MKECKKWDKFIDLAREWKKLWNMKLTIRSIIIDALGTVAKGLVQGREYLEIRERVETIQTCIIEIDQNTEKSPGDLKILVTLTLVRNHQLTLVWKKSKKKKKRTNNNNNHSTKCYMPGEWDTQNYPALWDTSILPNPCQKNIRCNNLEINLENKNNLLNSRLSRSSGPLNENRRKWKERQVLRLCQKSNIYIYIYIYIYVCVCVCVCVEHKGDSFTDCNWCVRNDSQRLEKGTRSVGNQRTSSDQQNYNIIEISQKKSPGYLRRLAISQTPGKDHQL